MNSHARSVTWAHWRYRTHRPPLCHHPCPPEGHSLRRPQCRKCRCKEFLMETKECTTTKLGQSNILVSCWRVWSCELPTSFLFVVVYFPFGRRWALTNVHQSYFTICSSIEDFLPCREIIKVMLDHSWSYSLYLIALAHREVHLPPSLLYSSKRDGGPGTSTS